MTSASVAGLVVNVEVASTIAFAVWLLGEHLNRRRVLGAAVTLLGVAYVGSADAPVVDLTARGHLLGNVMVMLAGVSWSLFAVAQRRAPQRTSLFQLLAPIFAVALLTTTPSLLFRGAWNVGGGVIPTLLLFVLIVLCTITVYVVYARCQQLVDVSVLAIVLATIPLFTVAFARLLLSEPLSARVIIGGVVVIAGVLVIASERPRGALLETAAVERAP